MTYHVSSDDRGIELVVDSSDDGVTVYSFTRHSDCVTKHVFENLDAKQFDIALIDYMYRSDADLDHEIACKQAAYENCEFWEVDDYKAEIAVLQAVKTVL